ncbi:hypothetical protein B0F90DRAFT_155928 [Multifurca ochricompacta]|uniref:Tetratricopeptide repeat protein n=1 Tax=Multifurca ochricompacta TaxID=376703 RepID=A0AAD4MH48_9AGAM|nr:hypothetical protein B0F90DRAFT_155928 [Multifurca ochricompacta]
MKQSIEQLATGTLERITLSDQTAQSGPFTLVALRRAGVHLLMSCASLSPADFASPVGFFGPSHSTPYYPTGDLHQDRNIAVTLAMDCLDDLQVLLSGSDKAGIADKHSALAQALTDLGLHEHALTTSNLALEITRDLYGVAPDNFRLHLASVQALRANIMVDLNKHDDAADAADEAVTLSREHQELQDHFIPEFAYALLNYATLLCSIGRKEGAAAVAFELMGLTSDISESLPDMKQVSALCQLCLSITCIEMDGGLASSSADQAIELSRASLDPDSRAILAGALLAKSKIFP